MKKTEWWALGLIAAAHLVLALPRWSLEVAPYGDNAAYFLRAEALATGQGWTALEALEDHRWEALITPPVVPVLLAAPMSLVGGGMASAKISFYVLMALLYAGIFLLFRRIDPRLALAVLAVLLVQPYLVSWSPYLYTDLPFAAGSLLLSALVYREGRRQLEGEPDWRATLAVGLAVGAMIGVRYIAVAWIAAWGACLALLALLRRRREVWRSAAAGIAGAALPVLALLLFFYLQSPGFVERYLGRVAPSAFADAGQARPGVPEVPPLERARRNAYLYAVEIWTGQPMRNHQVLWEPFGWDEGEALFHLDPLMTAFGVFTLLGLWRRRRSVEPWILALFAGAYGGVLLLSSNEEMRYLLPLIVLAIPFFVLGVDLAARRAAAFAGLADGRRLALAALVLWALACAAVSWPRTAKCWREGPDGGFTPQRAGLLEFREACRWLAENPAGGGVLLSYKIRAARVYSGLPGKRLWLFVGDGDLEQRLDVLDREIASFDDPVLLRDSDFWRTEVFIDPWLERRADSVEEIYRRGETALYRVHSERLRRDLAAPALDHDDGV